VFDGGPLLFDVQKAAKAVVAELDFALDVLVAGLAAEDAQAAGAAVQGLNPGKVFGGLRHGSPKFLSLKKKVSSATWRNWN
jgi:hypothetical protein